MQRSTIEPVGSSEAIADHVITKADRARNHGRLRAQADDPAAGLFGPDSVMWQLLAPLPVLGHMLVLAGLYEGAVPKIWFGTEHSVNRHGDFEARFARSYDAFATWFLGDVDACLAMSRKVNGYHSMIGGTAPHDLGDMKTGDAYRAAEEQLMLLTVATQVFPIKDFYEAVVRPLTAAERDRYHAECMTFARLFGIDDAALPPDWDAFERLWHDALASRALAVSPTGHDRYGPLNDQSALPFVKRWTTRWVMAVEFNLLPERLRAQYASVVPLARSRPRLRAASLLAIRTALRVLPAGLTTAPRARATARRTGTAGTPLRFETWLAQRLRHPYGEALPTLNTPAGPETDPRRSKAFTLPPV